MPAVSESVQRGSAPPTQSLRARFAARRRRAVPRCAPHLRECPDCGLFQTLPSLEPQASANCIRCDSVLLHGRANSLDRALVCAITALVLFALAVRLPFLRLDSVGGIYSANLLTGPRALQHDGLWGLTVVVLITLVIMPFVKLGMIIVVLVGLKLKNPPRFLPLVFGWVRRITPWSMVEVFLLGSFVAYSRLQAIATVDVGPALIALIGTMLCMVGADHELCQETVWQAMDRAGLLPSLTPPRDPGRARPPVGCDCCGLVVYAPPGAQCPRCYRTLRHRKPHSLARTGSLLLAAAVMYLPANLFPVMTVIRFGVGGPNTIFSGVIELLQVHMWPLALLVFLASITVPVFKLVGLSTMMILTRRGSASALVGRTRLYRVIDGIGRWSMIDVFMIAILVGLVHIGFVATVLPNVGAVAFASVVVLTMFASQNFDPRLMWDAAQRRARQAAPARLRPRWRRRGPREAPA